jgi:hypothetical protein
MPLAETVRRARAEEASFVDAAPHLVIYLPVIPKAAAQMPWGYGRTARVASGEDPVAGFEMALPLD